jgi:hypothetical protein
VPSQPSLRPPFPQPAPTPHVFLFRVALCSPGPAVGRVLRARPPPRTLPSPASVLFGILPRFGRYRTAWPGPRSKALPTRRSTNNVVGIIPSRTGPGKDPPPWLA